MVLPLRLETVGKSLYLKPYVVSPMRGGRAERSTVQSTVVAGAFRSHRGELRAILRGEGCYLISLKYFKC